MLDKTETIQENLNPDFAKAFKLDYCFEQVQPYLFKVYDHDDDGNHDFLGQVIVDLGAVVGSRGQTLIKVIVNKMQNVLSEAAERVIYV